MDGFIAHTFSPQDAHQYFKKLLRTADFLKQYRISYSQAQGAWYIMPVWSESPLVLDYSVGTSQGIVVPQRPLVLDPGHEHLQFNPMLRLPIFFAKTHYGVGFGLQTILLGQDDYLYNQFSEVRVGGMTTIHICINVSYHTVRLADKTFIPLRRFPSQWPGYDCWRCQIHTWDETMSRNCGGNPITLGQFMRSVGNSVNMFLNVSYLLLLPLLSLTKFLLF